MHSLGGGRVAGQAASLSVKALTMGRRIPDDATPTYSASISPCTVLFPRFDSLLWLRTRFPSSCLTFPASATGGSCSGGVGNLTTPIRVATFLLAGSGPSHSTFGLRATHKPLAALSCA